jgi:hypothetical protein
MILDELFEHAVLVTKMVWRKRGDKISRHEVKRMVATTVQPRYMEDDDES